MKKEEGRIKYEGGSMKEEEGELDGSPNYTHGTHYSRLVHTHQG